MTSRALKARWQTVDGRSLVDRVCAALVVGASLERLGLDQHQSRWDLRGMPFQDPSHEAVGASRGIIVERLHGVATFESVVWKGLDLSHARFPYVKFVDSEIVDCVFDGAVCRAPGCGTAP